MVKIVIVLCAASLAIAQEEDWHLKPVFPLAASDLRTVDLRPFLPAGCPRGSDLAGNNPDPLQTIDAVTFGHFTSPAAEDALVSVTGCESHANRYGGSYLLTRSGSDWRIIRYYPRMITVRCHKLMNGQGRDLLLCTSHWSGQGYVEQYLEFIDLVTPSKPRVTVLLTMQNGVRSCAQSGEAGNHAVPQSVIESVTFADQDGSMVVSVWGRTGMIQRTDAEYRACIARSNGGQWKNPPPVRTPAFRIDYTLQGSALVLTPESRTVMKRFQAVANRL